MENEFDYTVDGKAYTYEGFLQMASEQGWKAGKLRSAGHAAAFLRTQGHDVGYISKSENE
jgi:hypothetical protein